MTDSVGAAESLLREVIARVVAATEALEIGNAEAAWTILSDLELDLVAVLDRGRAR